MPSMSGRVRRLAHLAALTVAIAPAGAQSPSARVPRDSSAPRLEATIAAGEAQLQLRATARGTTTPILIAVRRAPSPRGDAVTGPVPAELHLEHAPALAFGVAAESLALRKDGPAKGDSAVVTLAGADGSLALVRLPDVKKKAAWRAHLTTVQGTTTVSLGDPEATQLALSLRDLGERLDPMATLDFARVHERGTQVDEPVEPVSQ